MGSRPTEAPPLPAADPQSAHAKGLPPPPAALEPASEPCCHVQVLPKHCNLLQLFESKQSALSIKHHLACISSDVSHSQLKVLAERGVGLLAF